MDARSVSDYLLPRMTLVGPQELSKNESIGAKVAELCLPYYLLQFSKSRGCRISVLAVLKPEPPAREPLNGYERSRVMHK
jgi:hypothetical protein